MALYFVGERAGCRPRCAKPGPGRAATAVNDRLILTSASITAGAGTLARQLRLWRHEASPSPKPACRRDGLAHVPDPDLVIAPVERCASATLLWQADTPSFLQ